MRFPRLCKLRGDRTKKQNNPLLPVYKVNGALVHVTRADLRALHMRYAVSWRNVSNEYEVYVQAGSMPTMISGFVANFAAD
jgi:hypothetical protein